MLIILVVKLQITLYPFRRHPFHKFASKFIPIRAFHNAISGHAFCSTQVAETKIMYPCKHMTGPIGNTTRQATRDEKKRHGDKDKKKRVVGSSCLYLRVPQQVAAS